MKELSIEQKAKAYDEAIERAKEKYAMFEGMKQGDVLEDVFPELKESEGERIRKYLKRVFGEWSYDDLFEKGFKKEDIMTWLEKQGQTFTKKDIDDAYLKGVCDAKHELEKQGEQKFKQKFFINDKVVHKATGKIWTIHHYLKDTNSYYVEDNDGLLHHYRESELKLVEQKPADKIEPKFKVGDKIISTISNIPYYITEVCDGHYQTDVGCIIMFNAQDNFELAEQKPAEWSEEDEMQLDAAIHLVSSTGHVGTTNWLKSLKERVQPKQEWSEEDKNALKVVTDVFGQYGVHLLNYPAFVHWLKTLPNRITFNPYWRPSDEMYNK